MATTYENVPVFRSGSSFGSAGPEHFVGKANVELHEDTRKVTITLDAGENLFEFISFGELKAFELNTFVTNVDREAAKDYWSRQP